MTTPTPTRRQGGTGDAAPPARERVYLYVRERILRGHFAAGAFVEEEQISSALALSRTPVREAFHRLEAEKFIDLLPRRGALVRQVTARELVELYETRRVIEGYAVGRICQDRIALPATLRAIHREMCEAAPTGDHFAHVERDRRFHRTLIEALANDVLAQAYDSLGSRQQRVAMTAMAVNPQRLDTILAELGALLDALETHDAAAARDVLDAHLRPVLDVVSRLPGFAGGG